MAFDPKICEDRHHELWSAISALRRLPLWAWVLITCLGPVALGLGGWSLTRCDSLGERLRGVEVRQDNYDNVIKEIRDDLKEIRRAVLHAETAERK